MIDAEQVATRRSEIIVAFEGFRDELDEHNDRRGFTFYASCPLVRSTITGERIIKTNRDITNLSKKLIFQLHRIAQDESTPEGRAAAIGRAKNKFVEVQKLYQRLQEDVAGERGWKYARSV